MRERREGKTMEEAFEELRINVYLLKMAWVEDVKAHRVLWFGWIMAGWVMAIVWYVVGL